MHVVQAATSLRPDAQAQGDGIQYLPQGNEVTLFEHAYRNRLPVLIKGPTGCGKTRLVRAHGRAPRRGRSTPWPATMT